MLQTIDYLNSEGLAPSLRARIVFDGNDKCPVCSAKLQFSVVNSNYS
ncbi:MAG: hypothetical protein IPG90_18950 [Bacteroidetes bacterium]|nr:hypothetical protein [Bacteroidota bacterium]